MYDISPSTRSSSKCRLTDLQVLFRRVSRHSPIKRNNVARVEPSSHVPVRLSHTKVPSEIVSERLGATDCQRRKTDCTGEQGIHRSRVLRELLMIMTLRRAMPCGESMSRGEATKCTKSRTEQAKDVSYVLYSPCLQPRSTDKPLRLSRSCLPSQTLTFYSDGCISSRDASIFLCHVCISSRNRSRRMGNSIEDRESHFSEVMAERGVKLVGLDPG